MLNNDVPYFKIAPEIWKFTKSLQTLFDKVNSLQNRLASLNELKQMLEQSQDLSSLNEIYCEVVNLRDEIEILNIRTLMDGKYDICANIPEGKRSIAYSLSFGANDRTLTDEEINNIMNKVITNLENKMGAELRG